MASIDKIYGTYEQYHEFKNWCSENKPVALEYFYNLYIGEHSKLEQPITNFPEHIDMWLLKNCPIDWVIERIQCQYDMGGN